MRLTILRAVTGCISERAAFVRFEVFLRRWLLPPFVRTTLPEPVRRKRLDVALWVFSFVLPAFAFRGMADFSFQTKLNRGIEFLPRTFNIFGLFLCRAIVSTSLGFRFFFQPEPAHCSISFYPHLWQVPMLRALCGLPFVEPVQLCLRQIVLQRSLSSLQVQFQDNPFRDRGT